MSIEYFVACTARLPERPRSWDEAFGPVSIASLPCGDDIRLQLEARLDGTEVKAVVVFSSRAGGGHLAFQFATALAKMSSGVVFDEESLDEPLADYRGYPAVALAGGIEKIWQMTVDTQARAVQLRARREQDEWDLLRRRDPHAEEEWS
jgi:hypothetical protein